MLRLATIYVAALVALAPLMLGSLGPVPLGINAIGAGIALGLTGLALATRHGRQIELAPELFTPALFAWLVLALWIVFQLIPGSAGELGHPAWGLAADALNRTLAGPISVDPMATKFALLRLVTAGAVFLSVYALARQRENAALLLGILVGFFCFHAAYGLIRVSFAIDRIWWFPAPDTGSLTGGFINRNTAATYFGLGVLAVTALFLRRLSRTLAVEGTLIGAARREALVSALTGKLGGLSVIWLLLLTALLLTGSRAGIVASLVAIAVMLLLRAFRSRRGEGGVTRLVAIGALLIGLAVIMEVAGAKFLSRVLVSGFEDMNRYYAAEATLAAAFDHLWTGAGAGAFQSVFPLYRPDSLDGTGFWNRAHNDYLEVLLGVGALGLAAMLFMTGSLAYRALRGVFARRRDSHFALIAVAATVLVGLHAFVDFSLRIQGVTLTYVALLAMGVAQSRSSRGG